MAITQEEIASLQPGDLVKMCDIIEDCRYEKGHPWRNVVGQIATVKCVYARTNLGIDGRGEKGVKLVEANDCYVFLGSEIEYVAERCSTKSDFDAANDAEISALLSGK